MTPRPVSIHIPFKTRNIKIKVNRLDIFESVRIILPPFCLSYFSLRKLSFQTFLYFCNRHEARENSNDQVAIDLSFASDWLRGWREFSRPITQSSKIKPMQSRITFDTQLKITLN